MYFPALANVVEQGSGQDRVRVAPRKLRHILAQFQRSPRYVERVQHQAAGDVQVMLCAERDEL